MVELATGVFVHRSEAFAMNAGIVLGAGRGHSAMAGDAIAGAAPDPSRGGTGAALLIDPAFFPFDLERIAGFLEERGCGAAWIVLTHSDWDHLVGITRWPEAKVVASSELPARAAREQERNARSLERIDRMLYVDRENPLPLPRPATLVGSPSDLVWQGRAVHLFPAGGHTSDGLMILLREEKILFAGDHLSDLEIPFVGDSISAYGETLGFVRRLAARGEIDTLVPGHGGVCGRDGILERLDEDADYLVRLDRWVRETRRTVETIEGLLERCDEVVYRKGTGNPDIEAEHRGNVAGLARALGMS